MANCDDLITNQDLADSKVSADYFKLWTSAVNEFETNPWTGLQNITFKGIEVAWDNQSSQIQDSADDLLNDFATDSQNALAQFSVDTTQALDNFATTSDALLTQKEQEFNDAISAIDGVDIGVWTLGVTTFNSYNEYATFDRSGVIERWYLRTNQPLGYTATTADPINETAFVYPSDQVTEQYVKNITIRKYSDVASMLADNPVAAEIGDRCSTGGTTWERISTANGDITDFTAVSSVYTKDFGALGNNDLTDIDKIVEAMNAASSSKDCKELILSGVVGNEFTLPPTEEGWELKGALTYDLSNCLIKKAPNGFTNYQVIRIPAVNDVTLNLEGCEIRGDRYQHDYITIPGTHEQGHCLYIDGAYDVIVNGGKMTQGTGDGINITYDRSVTFPYFLDPLYAAGGYDSNGDPDNSLPGYRTETLLQELAPLHVTEWYHFWVRGWTLGNPTPETADWTLVAFYYDMNDNFLESVRMPFWEPERLTADDHPDAYRVKLWIPEMTEIFTLPENGAVLQPGTGRKISKRITFNQVTVEDNRRIGGAHTGCVDIEWNNCLSKKNLGVAPASGFNLENSFNLRVAFNNCNVVDNGSNVTNPKGQSVHWNNCTFAKYDGVLSENSLIGANASGTISNCRFINDFPYTSGEVTVTDSYFSGGRLIRGDFNAQQPRTCIYSNCKFDNVWIQFEPTFPMLTYFSDCVFFNPSENETRLWDMSISNCDFINPNGLSMSRSRIENVNIRTSVDFTLNGGTYAGGKITLIGDESGVMPSLQMNSAEPVTLKDYIIETEGVTDVTGKYFLRMRNNCIVDNCILRMNHDAFGTDGSVTIQGNGAAISNTRIEDNGSGSALSPVWIQGNYPDFVMSRVDVIAENARAQPFLTSTNNVSYSCVHVTYRGLTEPTDSNANLQFNANV